MKAALIAAAGSAPVYGEFRNPAPEDGAVVVQMRAAAITHLTKSRASGAHYSSDGVYPVVPGVDGVGVTEDGRRVYFAMPETPFGALAEQSLVDPRRCVPVPEGVSDVDAAALANPGMSAWAALVERAHIQPGETVLVNGATGSAGTLAVQVAKFLSAGRILVSGRNAAKLEALRPLGADEVVAFTIDEAHPQGGKQFEAALAPLFRERIDVVLDYLWGTSARSILAAIARNVEDGHRVRFVQIGSAAGQDSIDLPSAALRSSAVELMGSGLKSVPLPALLAGIGKVLQGAADGAFRLPTVTQPLEKIAEAWAAPGEPRMVVTIP